MQYVKTVYGPVCGPFDSKIVYYRNIHPSNAIGIKVSIKTVHEGRDVIEYRTHVLQPNPEPHSQLPNAWDVEIGCPVMEFTLQRFHFKVEDAWLA